ncbi:MULTISPECIES: BMC domain-containing protein [unclassified Clostridium]|uniref:BMC domain-containing protein n=1 Tax=unclassified Clostridium TaxID=2614128 RepID=UPI001106DB3B|nr:MULTISPECIES: BMC domain-containing protein [unclassified Clostridium]
MKQALGLVEISGLSTAVVAADTMAKAANIRILEIENTKGLGYMTIKIAGDVGAVNAAVNAGKQIGAANNKLVSWKVIPRPSDYVEHAFCCPEPPVPPSPPKKEAQEETENGAESEPAAETENGAKAKKVAEPETAAEADPVAEPEAGTEAMPVTEAETGVQSEAETAETEPAGPEPAALPEKPKKASRRGSAAKGTGTERQKKS